MVWAVLVFQLSLNSPPENKPIDTAILNGVECEPYLTADHRLMLEQSEGIIKGLKIIMKILNAQHGMIGIESNKPDAIALEQTFNENNLSVVPLKLKYPEGRKAINLCCHKIQLEVLIPGCRNSSSKCWNSLCHL